MIKFAELSTTPHEFRKKFWLETLSLPLEWSEFSEAEKSNPALILKNTEIQGALVSPEFSTALYQASHKKPTDVIEAGMADSLVKEQKTMWLRCFLKLALKQLILEKAPQLDTHAFAYITGSGVLSRLCAVVAIQMGFRQLIVVVQDQDRLEATESFHNLQKLFFDLEIKILAETDLTLQPNNGSLLLNTVNTEIEGSAFEELLYFNFLRKDGLVVDLCFTDESSATNALVEEAKNVNMRLMTGIEVWGLRDFFFLQSLLQNQFQVSRADYLKAWNELFSTENQT